MVQVLGVDIGTSYLKATIARAGGDVEVLADRRERSPIGRIGFGEAASFNTDDVFAAVCSFIRETLAESPHASSKSIQALCLSGVSPILVAFDRAEPGRSVALPYWPIELVDEGAVGVLRTERRIAFLRKLAVEIEISNLCICDLIGYIAGRLTGQFGISTVALSELGVSHPTEWLDLTGSDIPVGAPTRLSGPLLREACGVIGVNSELVVCFGCPDSFASIVSSGAHAAGSHR